MEKNGAGVAENAHLVPYMSKWGAWAFSIGTAIGWGSFVVMASSYLSSGGPLGTVIGITIGALVMLIIARNYHFMMNRFPDAGGVYSFTKNVFGYDRAFLTSWFAVLAYMAMLCANATALPLFAGYFLGDAFKFGYLYNIFGYDVYIGEIMLSAGAILLVGLLTMLKKKLTSRLMIGLAAAFTIGITVALIAALSGHSSSGTSFTPLFIEGKAAFSQVIGIAVISPWAFIGFESISHSNEAFTFRRSKIFRILVISIVSTTLLYIFVTIISVSVYPAQFSSWYDYLTHLDGLSGLEAVPMFYAAEHYLGSFGVVLLMMTLFALIVTSLIGNITALSRLLLAVSKDGIIPERFRKLNKANVPYRAIWLIILVGAIVPFIGRSAIGWIVDINTICALLVYGFVSAAAFKLARRTGERLEQITGLAGFILMIALGLLVMLPALFGVNTLEPESYFLLTLWSIIGFIFFRTVIAKDGTGRFGHAMLVWVILLMFVLFSLLSWMMETTTRNTNNTISGVQTYLAEETEVSGESIEYVGEQLRALERSNSVSTFVVVGMFTFSLAIMLSNYSLMRRREKETESKLTEARMLANTDPLTGVKSKHAYVERERIMDASFEDGSVEDFAIVVADVNGLKYINDTFGHKAGDEHIKKASAFICGCFKHSPVYRIGGDEFVVIMRGEDYENRTSILAEFDRRVEENLFGNGVIVAAGMSSCERGVDAKVGAVFHRADELMYARKELLKSMNPEHGKKTRRE